MAVKKLPFSKGSIFGLWSVTDGWILFLKPAASHDELRFYDLRNRNVRLLGRLPSRVSRVGGYGQLTASRDGRWAL
jgi:hypothetical protein